VLTITVNPALDVSMTVDRLVPDAKLRARDSRREAGGGGVNVSRVLQRLGVPSTAFVVAGGPIGAELIARMEAEDLDVTTFTIPATTRESVAVAETITNRQYRLSIEGPMVDDADDLHRCIIDAAGAAGILVLSGTVAPGLPDDFYARIIADLAPGTTTIVDTHGPPLAAVTAGTATIVKPSQRELAELVGWEPATALDIERAAREVLEQGSARAVVASRGPSGALLAVRGGGAMWFRPPPVRPVSTVGAGDSMVAGIAASLFHGSDLEDAVRHGVAAGTATVLTPGTALCERTDVERFVDQVTVTGSHERGRAR
jgi:6-phosphofructokinase 2